MKRLVLAGPGHAHLFVLEALARTRWPGVETVLVSRGRTQLYSGRVPGYLAGQYALEALSFDLEGLARAAGARLEPDGVTGLDADRRELRLGDGRMLTYDAASFDIGSLPAGDTVPGVREHAVFLKPLEGALSRLASGQETGPLLVVGGGAAGVEVALCLQARTGRPTVLLEDGPQVPRGASRAAVRQVRGLLERRGIHLRLESRVTALETGVAHLDSGERLAFGTCGWPPPSRDRRGVVGEGGGAQVPSARPSPGPAGSGALDTNQRGSQSAPFEFVNCVWPLPSARIRNSSTSPVRSDANARYFPSGLHSGWSSVLFPSVSATGSPPAMSATQMRAFWSFARPTKASFFPSGLHAGSRSSPVAWLPDTARSPVPSGFTTNTRTRPSRSLRNEIHFPSGLQRGAMSSVWNDVSRRTSVPSAFIT